MNESEPRGNQDGDKIRQLRKDAGLTVTELAERIGVVPGTLSNIELGNKPAGLGLLIRIAKELGKQLDTLVKVAA
jgi:XRE family transcriptional regulator, fatty acid utilization regulator